MKNYAVEIGDVLVTAIQTVNTSDSLGLQCIDQGDFARFFAPDFSSIMPAALVGDRHGDMLQLMMARMEIAYPFRVRVFRQQLDVAENPYKLTKTLASAVWRALVATTSGTVQNRPSWASSFNAGALAGCEFVKVEAGLPTLDNAENLFLNQPEYRANCAWIDLVVTARSLPT